jgi:recombination protein RecT
MAQQQTNGAIAPQQNRQPDPVTLFKGYLEARKDNLAAIIPKTLTLERVMKVAIAAYARTPDLRECTVPSIYMSINQAVQLGLEPAGPLGHAYLVPFNNKKTRQKECQLIVGYKGLIALARRSGEIVSIESHVVYERDKLDLRYGLERKLDHVPCLDGDPGKPRLVYAIAHLKDGGVQMEAMTIAQVEKIKARSKASDSGPWVTDFEEMARKTVIRRLAKYLPLSVELAEALDDEDRRDGPVDLGGVTSIPTTATPTVEDVVEEMPPHDPVTGEVKEQAAALPEQAGGAVAAPAQPSMAERMRGELRAPAEPANEKRATAPAKQVDAGLEASIFDEISDAETAEQLQKAMKRLRENESALTSYQFGKLFERAQKIAKRLGVTL